MYLIRFREIMEVNFYRPPNTLFLYANQALLMYCHFLNELDLFGSGDEKEKGEGDLKGWIQVERKEKNMLH